MLKTLSNFLKFGSLEDKPQSAKQHDTYEIHLAAAVLLVEAAMMEGEMDADERKTIGRVLEQRFDLSHDEVQSLVSAAVDAQDEAVEIHRFTNVLKQNFSEEEREQIMEMIWEVAYADGVLHDYEAHLARKVGGLIHVSDRARGEARKRVLARLGLG